MTPVVVIFDQIVAKLQSVGIEIQSHAMCQHICFEVDCMIASPAEWLVAPFDRQTGVYSSRSEGIWSYFVPKHWSYL